MCANPERQRPVSLAAEAGLFEEMSQVRTLWQNHPHRLAALLNACPSTEEGKEEEEEEEKKEQEKDEEL